MASRPPCRSTAPNMRSKPEERPMTLNEAILAKVADWRPSGRQTILIPDEGTGWTVAVTADRSDEVGCLVWETVARRCAGRAEEALGAWEVQLGRRVTRLLQAP